LALIIKEQIIEKGESPFLFYMGYSLTNWLENNMQTCAFKQMTGKDCPGCGSQRSFFLLLKGQIGESICMYPALIPIIILFLFLIVHLIFKFNKGGTFLKYNFIVVMSIIVVSYLFKILR
jgi:hypothetical protein